jgi:hypothetical protein
MATKLLWLGKIGRIALSVPRKDWKYTLNRTLLEKNWIKQRNAADRGIERIDNCGIMLLRWFLYLDLPRIHPPA